MTSAFLSSIAVLVLTIISLYKWVIIISALLSWVRPDPNNPIMQVLYKLTEPVYALIRRLIPTVFGNIDLSPVILLFILIFLQTFLGRLFATFL